MENDNAYNVLFVKGLDYLKKNKNFTFKRIANDLGLEPKDVYNMRDGIKKVSHEVIENFERIFPKVYLEINKEIRSSEKTDNSDAVLFHQKNISPFKLIEIQTALIESQEREIERLNKELEGLDEIGEQVRLLEQGLKEMVDVIRGMEG